MLGREFPYVSKSFVKMSALPSSAILGEIMTIEKIVEEISNIKVKALNCSIKIQEQGLDVELLDEIFQKSLRLEQKIRNAYKIGRFYKE